MLDTVHIHTAVAPSSNHPAQTYAVIARRGRRHITLTGRLSNSNPNVGALRAAAEGIRAAKLLFSNPVLRRLIPITVHLPSEEAALAANGLTRHPLTPTELRLMRLLSKATTTANVIFTDKPAQENSAIDVICQHIATTEAESPSRG